MNHLEFAAEESRQIDSDVVWERWCDRVEKLLGHSLDGNQSLDGYSLDYALERFKAGWVPEGYAAEVAKRKSLIASVNDLKERFARGEFKGDAKSSKWSWLSRCHLTCGCGRRWPRSAMRSGPATQPS